MVNRYCSRNIRNQEQHWRCNYCYESKSTK